MSKPPPNIVPGVTPESRSSEPPRKRQRLGRNQAAKQLEMNWKCDQLLVELHASVSYSNRPKWQAVIPFPTKHLKLRAGKTVTNSLGIARNPLEIYPRREQRPVNPMALGTRNHLEARGDRPPKDVERQPGELTLALSMRLTATRSPDWRSVAAKV